MTTPASESVLREPSAAQSERAASLRRFNLLFVYLPVAIVAMIVLVLLGLLLWGAFAPHIVGTQDFASALADIIITLTVIPLTLLCALVPGAALAILLARRKQPDRPYGRFQSLLWRLDDLADKSRGKSDLFMRKVAQVIVEIHAGISFVRAFARHLKRIFIRS